MHQGGQQHEDEPRPVLRAAAQPEGYSPLRLFFLLFFALLLPFIGPLLTLVLGSISSGRKGSTLLVRSSIALLCLQMLGVAAAVLLAPLFLKFNAPEQQAKASPLLARSAASALYEAQDAHFQRTGKYAELAVLHDQGMLSGEYSDPAYLERNQLGISLALKEGGAGYSAVVSRGDEIISFSDESPPPGG